MKSEEKSSFLEEAQVKKGESKSKTTSLEREATEKALVQPLQNMDELNQASP
jgi:hypothetical protein